MGSWALGLGSSFVLGRGVDFAGSSFCGLTDAVLLSSFFWAEGVGLDDACLFGRGGAGGAGGTGVVVRGAGGVGSVTGGGVLSEAEVVMVIGSFSCSGTVGKSVFSGR